MYKLSQNSNSIIRLADNAFIPDDPANTDYANYLKWVAEGNLPQAADPVVVPEVMVVSMRQARLALLGAGLLTQINDALVSLPGVEGEAARIEWEYATEVRKDSALVSSLTSALGLTAEQLTSLFDTAATL